MLPARCNVRSPSTSHAAWETSDRWDVVGAWVQAAYEGYQYQPCEALKDLAEQGLP
jgi:hypothetical protein